MSVCPKCGHEGLPATASFCPMCGEVVPATPAAAPAPPKTAKEDPHEARTEVISQDEIKSRMGEIRDRMNKMRGDASSVSKSNRPARPSKPAKAKRKGFSETLWFMQVQDPDSMVVDSNTDIEQGDLQDKYTKKQPLEMNVRKEFSLNVDLDDFDD